MGTETSDVCSVHDEIQVIAVRSCQGLPLFDLLKLVLCELFPEILRRHIRLIGDGKCFLSAGQSGMDPGDQGIQLFYKLGTHNYKFCAVL